MKRAHFRFYAELNDFLPRARRQTAFACRFQGRVSIKHMIEALGVPHPEVDLVLVNGQSVDFSHLVQDGDRISVFPVFESLAITPLVRLRPQPLREPTFVLDTHLGRLAAHLRMLGFDTLYWNDSADEELALTPSTGGFKILSCLLTLGTNYSSKKAFPNLIICSRLSWVSVALKKCSSRSPLSPISQHPCARHK